MAASIGINLLRFRGRCSGTYPTPGQRNIRAGETRLPTALFLSTAGPLAISWEGKVYIDRALPFGLRSAPKIFSAVADIIAWALHCSGIQHQIHYLDDFLFIGALNTDEGRNALAIARRVLEYLGVPVVVCVSQHLILVVASRLFLLIHYS